MKSEAVPIAFGCEAVGEYPSDVLLRETNTGIVNLDSNPVGGVVTYADADLPDGAILLNDRLLSIADQVHQDFNEPMLWQ